MSNITMNQEWVLRRFREDSERDDPEFYTVRWIFGRPHVWMKIGGNVGWYQATVRNGELIELHSLGSGGLDSHIGRINPKQKRKIAALVDEARKNPIHIDHLLFRNP